MIATHLLIVLIMTAQAAANPVVKKQASKKPLKGAMGTILDVNVDQGFDYFEGDIRLPEKQPQNSRNAILDENLKWNSVIPYVIHSQYPYEVRDKIESVLREYSVRLCVDFVPREKENSYLIYTKDSGCFSSVGMIGNEQIVSIGDGCESDGVIKHETMHALGFWHEQSRYDRDDYVEIMWENIQSGKEHNFEKYTEEEITLLNETYDYSSVMHYPANAFSSNGEDTIIALFPGGENMGQREGFSETDLRKLRKLYNCEPINGWTNWTEWSSCDSQCKRYRKRFCEGTNCTEESDIEWTDCDTFCIVDRDKDCRSPIIAGLYGVVTSPLFPYNYKTDVDCTQTIIAPPGHTIELDFEFIDIEDYQGICYYDWLKVYDGRDTSSLLLGNLCGTSAPANIKSYGNALTLEFFSDVSITQRGFLANFYTSHPRAPIHMCHFEGDISSCGWSHDSTADFQWTRNKGSTVSGDTGPSYDHTTEGDQGFYLFIETSSPQTNGMKARVLTPTFPAPTNGNCLEFSYNMFGENVDRLSVLQLQEVISGDPVEFFTIFLKSGNHGNDDWITTRINIFGQFSYKLAFQGRRGNGWMGDLAIDDVIIHSSPCGRLGPLYDRPLNVESKKL